MPAKRSEADKRMSSYLKKNGVERTSGKCACCYKTIPNDTFGGSGAMRHYPAGCINRGGNEKGV